MEGHTTLVDQAGGASTRPSNRTGRRAFCCSGLSWPRARSPYSNRCRQIAKKGRSAVAISLYDLSVPTFLQTLGGVEGFLGRGLAHCQDNNIDPNEIVETPACARARATVRP